MTKRLITILLLIISISCFFVTEYGYLNEKLDNKDETNEKNSSENLPAITISADKDKAQIGDLIDLSIKYNLPQGSIIDLSDFEGLEGLTVIRKQESKGLIILTILLDKTQPFKIGPISLTFKDKNNDLNIIKSEILNIEVLSKYSSCWKA